MPSKELEPSGPIKTTPTRSGLAHIARYEAWRLTRGTGLESASLALPLDTQRTLCITFSNGELSAYELNKSGRRWWKLSRHQRVHLRAIFLNCLTTFKNS